MTSNDLPGEDQAMKISVLLATSENRGDHAADLRVAHEVRPGETVEELVRRLLHRRRGRGGSRVPEPIPSDHIELRVVVEPSEVDW